MLEHNAAIVDIVLAKAAKLTDGFFHTGYRILQEERAIAGQRSQGVDNAAGKCAALVAGHHVTRRQRVVSVFIDYKFCVAAELGSLLDWFCNSRQGA